jgi:hypothetical protein
MLNIHDLKAAYEQGYRASDQHRTCFSGGRVDDVFSGSFDKVFCPAACPLS